MYKLIQITDLVTLFPDARHKWLLYLMRPFTIGKIGCFGYKEMKDYPIDFYWRKWFFYLTYPVRVLWALLYCLWDGGLCEFSFPTNAHVYGLRCEWVDADNDMPFARERYENAKKLWERA